MIHFMKYRWLYFLISALVLVPGMYYLLRFGLHPAIDFTGGTLLELKINPPAGNEKSVATDNLKKTTEELQVEISSIQTSGEATYIFKLKKFDNEQKNQLIAKFTQEYKEVTELRYETVGPILGKELLQKTFIASLIAISVILLYVAWAFKNVRFGVAAIIALVHDVLVVVGIFAILGNIKGVEVDALFVTAVLTTMSFSVHDTIVVFDRIRELSRKSSQLKFEDQINQALTETMGRSLNNSLTIIFMLLALFLLGGETISWFVFALLIGTISGTYSSPFVATPILFTWDKIRERKN